MADVVTVHDTIPTSPGQTQVDAPAGYCVAAWYAVFGANAPQQWTAYEFATDGDDNITGVVFLADSSAYEGYLECVPIEAGDAATVGTATLTAGAASVSYSAMNANSRVFLQRETAGGTTVGSLYEVTARTNSTGFTIGAILAGTGLTNALDTSVVAWQVIEA